MDQYTPRIAEALRVTFDPNGDFTNDAPEVMAALRRGESRIAVLQRLANIQLNATGIVSHKDCTHLADELLKWQRSSGAN